MKLSGRTPLLRAINLEKKLKVKKIYIKLEGANPSHDKNARIAEVLCKDAVAHKKTIILVDGTNAYIRAIEFFARENDLKIIIPRFNHETWKMNRFELNTILDARKEKITSRMDYLSSVTMENDYYLAVEGYTNKNISLMALEELTKEIIEKKDNIDTITTQFSHGYTLTSMYNVFLREWIEKEKSFPKIFCGINIKGELKTESLGHDLVSYMHENQDLLVSSKIALEETYGKTIKVSEEELKDAKRLLRSVEQIKVSVDNAYPLAAFISRV
ncbi:MAG: pyridoxal-phosphate dependent enzyme, partial [Firmicutes bacterium]|nr:pyridoxal-phosphate dependent enzyme [Bacillota bacterium]